MDPLLEKILILPRELRDTIYLFIIETDSKEQPIDSWPQMSQPWPFIIPFETEGNALWQELQQTFYERTVFHFRMEPDVDFRSVRLPSAAGNPRGLARYPCLVRGMANRFGFYRRPNWYSRIMRATVSVKLPSACTSAAPGRDGGAGGGALLSIPGRDLACKSGPHYVAVAKAAWLLQHAVSLQELTVEVTVQDPPESRRTGSTNSRPEEWVGLMEPFLVFKRVMKMASMYRKSSSSTAGIIFANDDWCSDFHIGYNRSESVIRRCPDPNFELLPGNHWGSYVCIEGSCPCGRSFEDTSSQNWAAENETEYVSPWSGVDGR
jgi:hypothetical protein